MLPGIDNRAVKAKAGDRPCDGSPRRLAAPHLKVSLMAVIWKCHQRGQNPPRDPRDQRLHGCGDRASPRGWNGTN